MADQQPLVLCIQNTAGEDVAIPVQPGDDFQAFLDKAKAALGFEVHINSIAKNQPVSLTDNVYQFLITNEKSFTEDADVTSQNLDQIIPPDNDADDLVYVLDDGTQIRASQIHFDNEDPLVDLSIEKLPFVKYANDPTEVDSENIEVEHTILYNIVQSPISKRSRSKDSPKGGFANSLPFKLINNNISGFEAQFTKFLETGAKSYATLKNATGRKSPRSLIRDNYKQYDDAYPGKGDDFSHYTRDEILNMFKDAPVVSVPYEKRNTADKRRHVRKSNPTRMHKSWNAKPAGVEIDGIVIAQSGNESCFICKKYVENDREKLYLFDDEDQRVHRFSPQKISSTQLKIICQRCLEKHFKASLNKKPNQSLNPDEYLVIRNYQQYVFQKTMSIQLGNTSKRMSAAAPKDKDSELVEVEIGFDGEIVTTPISIDVPSDDVIILNDDERDRSSDVEIIENAPAIDDNVIDNLEEADDDVIEFLGKYQCEDSRRLDELKCRFCDRTFADVSELIEHGQTHRHDFDEGQVYPCPLCDYGYANFNWLKGHLKAAHDKKPIKEETDKINKVENVNEDAQPSPLKEPTSPPNDTSTPLKSTTPLLRDLPSPIKESLSSPECSITLDEPTSLAKESPKPLKLSSTPPVQTPTPPPEDASVIPKESSISPKESPMTPKESPMTPKESSMSPKVSSMSPKVSSMSPKVSSISPRESSISPKESSISPRESSISPKESSMSPKDSSMSPTSPIARRTRSAAKKSGTKANKTVTEPIKTVTEAKNTVTEANKTGTESKKTGTEAKRTASETKKTVNMAKKAVNEFKKTVTEAKHTVVEVKKESPEKQENSVTVNVTTSESAGTDFIIKTEVKQEAVGSSDDEIWIVQTGDAEAEKQLANFLQTAQNKKGVKKVKCNICSQLFVSAEGLAHHKCQRGRKRKCPSKEEPVLLVPTREDFMKRAGGKPRLQGSSNDDSTTAKPRKKDKQPTSDPLVVTCNDCDKSFTSKVRLKFHMQFHNTSSMLTADGQYACAECDSATFATETELFDHAHFQHKQKRWQCPVTDCGKTFYLRATLTKHSRSHTDTRRYACDECGKRFLDKQTLDEHGVTHLRTKPFQCHVCLKQLTRRSRLRMHLRAHEEALRPRLLLVCAPCARAFRHARELQDHVEKSSECLEAFASELKEEATETVQLSPTSGIVQYSVSATVSPKLSKPIPRQAGDALAAPLLASVGDAARAVARVVEVDKAFRCEYCEDVFYSEDGLNAHRVIHRGVKNPFTCHICKVAFASYSRCTTHKTTHGFYKRRLPLTARCAEQASGSAAPAATAGVLGYGDFPVVKHFLCEDCGRSYLHWTYLQVHRRMKHAVDSKCTCDQCGTSFPNSWSVAYHKKKAHRLGQHCTITSKIVKEDYKIPCRDCDLLLPNKTALYKHRKKEHSSGAPWPASPPRAAACAKCGHSFADMAALNAHWWEEHGSARAAGAEAPYPCDVCGDTFTRSSAMRAHRLCHAKPRTLRTRLALVEVPGLNPSPEQVMRHLSNNDIPLDKVIDITKMSFPKGAVSVVPDSSRALAQLAQQWPVTQVACSSAVPRGAFDLYQNARNVFKRPRVQPRVPRVDRDLYPVIIPVSNEQDFVEVPQQGPIAYPIAVKVSGEELSELNVQLLARETAPLDRQQVEQLHLDTRTG